jgi:hypothetical protein
MTLIRARAPLSGFSWIHAVLSVESVDVGLPDFFESLFVGHRGHDHLE